MDLSFPHGEYSLFNVRRSTFDNLQIEPAETVAPRVS
jgi:hypothetical protein